MEKIYLYERTAARELFAARVHENLEKLNNLLSLYTSMGLTPFQDLTELRRLCESEDLKTAIKQILVDSIPDKNPSLNYNQIVILPAGFDAFQKSVAGFTKGWRYRLVDWSMYVLIGAKVIINQRAQMEATEAFKVFASTEVEIRQFKLAEKLAECYNEIQNEGASPGKIAKFIREKDGRWEVYKIAIKPESKILERERYTKARKPEFVTSDSELKKVLAHE